MANFRSGYGVLTPVFLKDSELSISSDYLRKAVSFIWKKTV